MEKADTDEIAQNLRKNNKGMYFDAVTDVYKVDLDNDGEPDNFATTVQGSAHGIGFIIYDDNWKERQYAWEGFPDQEDEDVRWSEPGSIARYKGRIYVIWQDNSGRLLSFVSVFDKGTHRFVCKFGYTADARTTISHAKNRLLCNAVLQRQVQYARFDRPTSFPPDHCFDSGGPACAGAGATSAAIDIDNDGKTDLLVQMGVAWGGGRGCDFSFLAMSNKTGDDIAKSIPNSTLMTATQKWGVCGGAESRPFRYNKTWYVENKYPEGNVFNFHNVIQLMGSKIEEVCSYSVVRTPYVE